MKKANLLLLLLLSQVILPLFRQAPENERIKTYPYLFRFIEKPWTINEIDIIKM